MAGSSALKQLTLPDLRRDWTFAAPGQLCAPASRDDDELDPLALARGISTRSAARLARSGERDAARLARSGERDAARLARSGERDAARLALDLDLARSGELRRR
jgi:hypothetical protein